MTRIYFLFFVILMISPCTLYATPNDIAIANQELEQHQYASAIKIYSKIVHNNPNRTELRYKLAQAYFYNHEYNSAQFHFLFLLATPNLPTQTIQDINNYLTQIRRKRNYSLDIGIGSTPDSNINYAITNRHECIQTINGIECHETNDRHSGINLQINGVGNYYAHITERLSMQMTFGGILLNTSNNHPNDYSTHLAIGPHYAFNHGEISIQPIFGTRWLNHKVYNYSYGFRIHSDWQLNNKTHLNIGLLSQYNKYDNFQINHALHGFEWTAYIQPRYYIDNTKYITLILSSSHNHTATRPLGANIIHTSLGYFQEFDNGFNIYTSATFSHDTYHQTSKQFTINNALHTDSRNDNTLQFYIRIYNTNINIYDFVPAISYTYTTRNSNIQKYKQNSNRINFEILHRF